MQTINHENDIWEVLSKGITENGLTFCHLASTTRFSIKKNGKHPVQINDWVEVQ